MGLGGPLCPPSSQQITHEHHARGLSSKQNCSRPGAGTECFAQFGLIQQPFFFFNVIFFILPESLGMEVVELIELFLFSIH